MGIYEEIRESRKKTDTNCKSIRSLAKALNLQPIRISELERGKRTASHTELKKYHDYFGISYDELINEHIENKVESDMFYAEIASREKTTIDRLYLSDRDSDILIKQTINLLLSTEVGEVLLYKIAETVFGVEDYNYPDGEILLDKNSNEFKMIHNKGISAVAKELTRALLLLRDTKYRGGSYDDLRIMLINMESERRPEDTYSSKCRF